MPSVLEWFVGGAIAGIGFSLGSSGMQKARPLLKGAIRGCLVATERAREMAAGMGETLDDIVAEAKAEIEAESARAVEKQPVGRADGGASSMRTTAEIRSRA
jgi:hypothetical protein